MGGKIMLISTIKQLLLFHTDGHGLKYILRHTGMSKNTDKSFFAQICGASMLR